MSGDDRARPRRQRAGNPSIVVTATAELAPAGRRRLQAAGFSILAFDFRRLGAAAHPELAAAIAQAPLADGPAISPNALRAMTPGAALRLQLRAARDLLGRRLLRRPPALIPLAGPRGAVASLTTRDGARGGEVLDPDGRYPAGSRAWPRPRPCALPSPARAARLPAISCPLLVVVYDDDHSVLTSPPTKVAERAPRGEVMRLAGDHYAAFEDARDATLDAEIAFLRRHAVSVGEPEPPIRGMAASSGTLAGRGARRGWPA